MKFSTSSRQRALAVFLPSWLLWRSRLATARCRVFWQRRI